ncbi:hypothetical protein E3N88_13628 [Mikania micrantha]|uniref:Reverse transcriptase Ty1/copia-type domain-containing protein n=1 Tax=Mikania micrantha TaxID=192012 RepID=A0A5N6P0C2_9ASTR|nr:hypothetical protein E3N88_13628 [Mikania micrantha]
MDAGKFTDPTSYHEAITSDQSSEWKMAMTDELDSMKKNNVWDLVELPNGVSLRKRELTIKRPSLLSLVKIP